jgi:hypothetical protein
MHVLVSREVNYAFKFGKKIFEILFFNILINFKIVKHNIIRHALKRGNGKHGNGKKSLKMKKNFKNRGK